MERDGRLKIFIDDLNFQMVNNYEMVKDIFNAEYGYLVLDSIRDEICKCFICGLYQSTITLTNHFLEKSLKFCLAMKYSIENKADNTKIKYAFIGGIDKYDKLHLEDSINAACTQGLISKKQKQELKDFKNNLRNPYSHANKTIFSGKSVKGKQVSKKDLENGPEDFLKLCFDNSKDEEIPIENLPSAQGFFQVEIAKKNSLPYFKSVDKIVRDMLLIIKEKKYFSG